MTLALRLAADAEADIDDSLEWSVRRFGFAVRDGYEELIHTAIQELLADPEHPGTRERPELGRGIRIVHLFWGRDHVGPRARRILTPRHFVVYRKVDQTLRVVRILHDAMDLSRPVSGTGT